MSDPISPPPVKGSGRRELPAYVSNGLIGLRVREVPLSGGLALLSGYSGEHPERRIEAAAVAPYPMAGDVALGGIWLSDAPHQVSDLEQRYDFASGELTTLFVFKALGRQARVEVTTFCSRTDPSLVCQEIALELDGACDVGLRAIIDASGIDGRALRYARDTPGEPEPAVDGSVLWQSAGGLSTCGVALVTDLLDSDEPTSEFPSLAGHRLMTEYSLHVTAGRKIRLRQIASVIPDALHQAPDQQATRLAAKARHDGFDKIRADNRLAWLELWKGRIELVGAG
jgi:trehalose/maltose hydrolase-like predicted phosphorylase